MQVRAGVISNLYVGVSVQFFAEEDLIVTTGRMEDPGGGQFLIAPTDGSSPQVRGMASIT